MRKENYFDLRLQELHELLSKSQSATSALLLNEAIDITKKANIENQRIKDVSTIALNKYQEILKRFNSAYEQMKKGAAQIRLSASGEYFSTQTKQKIIAAADSMSSDIEYEFERRKLANRSVHDAIEFCEEQLSEILQDLIFKPNSGNFIFDSVIAILNKLVTGWIPYSDAAEYILETSIAKRKKDYLNSGDKILVYLEEYISVVKTWLALNEQFEKDVLQE